MKSQPRSETNIAKDYYTSLSLPLKLHPILVNPPNFHYLSHKDTRVLHCHFYSTQVNLQ